MSSELIVNSTLPETRIVLMENGEIQELFIERAEGKGVVGNIYKGKVTRVLPGMQAAFVDIGLEKAAFLYVDDVFIHGQDASEDNDKNKAEDQKNLEVEAELVNSILEDESGARDLEEAKDLLSNIDEADEKTLVMSDSDANTDEANAKSSDLEEDDKTVEVKEDSEDDQPVEMANKPSDEDELKEDTVEQEKSAVEPPVSAEAGESKEKEVVEKKDGNQEEGSKVARPSGKVRIPRPRKKEDTVESPVSVEAGESKEKKDDSQEEGSKVARPSGKVRIPRPRKKKVTRSKKPEDKNVDLPESYYENLTENKDVLESDRTGLSHREQRELENESQESKNLKEKTEKDTSSVFREPRGRDRRVRRGSTVRPPRPRLGIQDLLKEGQDVIVQVAKEPIAAKGARLTCHISLPGRHLVCMPTINHIGISRRIEREDERRKLKQFVDKTRSKKIGFIVRTASGGKDSEKSISQDMSYLTDLWEEIFNNAKEASAPSLVYEDLNPVLKAVRDWVHEDIVKVVVDTRYQFDQLKSFVNRFMPILSGKIEYYQGDIPIFDAYGISTEMHRALDRKVWLKSGGYIVIDQAEALVAIDVNTGRFVGQRSLEDTILKTNLEAVREVAYQLRLRNCGGIIIIDLIDMEREESKRRVYRALEDELMIDRARPTILKISELGLIEMTRKRTRDTMVRALCQSCPSCEGKGFVKNSLTVAYEILRDIEREGIQKDAKKILIQAHPNVIDILARQERETLDQLEKRYRKQIYLQADAELHPEQYEVIPDKSVDKRYKRPSARDSASSRSTSRKKPRNTKGPQQRTNQRYSKNKNSTFNESKRNQNEETDNVGQPAVKPLDKREESFGNVDPNYNKKENTQNTKVNESKVVSNDSDGFDSEEDRLAFLRAQAAQDAALAGMGGEEHGGNGGGSAPSKGYRRNRRNPKFGGRGRQGQGQGQGRGGYNRKNSRFGNKRQKSSEDSDSSTTDKS